ncbi:hypothetical protein HPB51_009111 [Rhipicephalus microplus]|uniref:Protein ALP1-like n=1 Tax=Rhipicephalus microplus TaxID=6941 RepID=A0A9J6F057_RHIMP|nr:hypothetical protein HPB51_009111 [Rhipicephalus microplus]
MRRVSCYERYRNAMLLGIAYASNIGGTGSVIGTAPNLVLMGLVEELYPNSGSLSFATWMIYNVPTMIVCVVFAWFYLYFQLVPKRSVSILLLWRRYVSNGESHHSLSRQFRLGHSTVNDIIHETCNVIYEELKNEFLKTPSTEDEWRDVVAGFSRNWNFPNCVGAMDGKHVIITKPANTGTVYRNYKKSFSIILFAVVDANYKFLYTDVGAPGSQGDAGVWQTTPLQAHLSNMSAGLPELVKVGSLPDLYLPPVFVGDDAFPLGRNLMKPFGGTFVIRREENI